MREVFIYQRTKLLVWKRHVLHNFVTWFKKNIFRWGNVALLTPPPPTLFGTIHLLALRFSYGSNCEPVGNVCFGLHHSMGTFCFDRFSGERYCDVSVMVTWLCPRPREETASSEQWTSRLGFILPAASASLIPVHSIYETAKCESTHLPLLKCSWPSLP